MEFEQIIKRLDWLDAEQRKTKAAISAVEEKIASVETSVAAVSQQVKNVEKEISDFASSAARINQFNELLAKQRDDFNRLFEEAEKKHQLHLVFDIENESEHGLVEDHAKQIRECKEKQKARIERDTDAVGEEIYEIHRPHGKNAVSENWQIEDAIDNGKAHPQHSVDGSHQDAAQEGTRD